MTVNDIQNALDSLRDAKESAGLGTRMMLQDVIDDTESLLARTESIQGDDDDGS